MLVLTWNVRFQTLSTQLDGIVDAITSAAPDVLTLQEVKPEMHSRLRDRLGAAGLLHFHDGLDGAPAGPHGQKIYTCVIASRWPLVPADAAWRERAPFPELLARAIVETPDGRVDVLTAHIPNGSFNGWRKIDTFEVLVRELRRADDAPRILTGDFNEPRQFRRSGQIVTFGEALHEGGGTSSPAWRDRSGVERPGIEWTNGVLSVLAGAAQHGLRDSYRHLHGSDVTPVTHVTRGRPRCFDHTFVSRHFEVLGCGYHHEWRERNLSDHSAMWTRLALREDQPPLVEWEETSGEHEDGADE